MAELTDQEMNDHMDDYEDQGKCLQRQRGVTRITSRTMELRLTVTPLFQLDFHLCVDLRCLFIVFCGYKIGRHLGHAFVHYILSLELLGLATRRDPALHHEPRRVPIRTRYE